MLCRWILPFNRELTLGALAQAPLIPWRWKMDATHWWLKRYFYGPAGIVHMMPGAGNKAAPRDNDYAGKGASTLSSRCVPQVSCACWNTSTDCCRLWACNTLMAQWVSST